MRPARAGRRAGPRAILALFEEECETISLKHAVTLARGLDAPLHVLRVIPRPTRLRALFSRRTRGMTRHVVQRIQATHQATRAWLRDSLGADDVIEHVFIAHGDFVAQTAVYAANIGAKLILVAPGEGRLAKTVKSLACATLLPVVVARAPTGASTILVATDLRNPDYPVLSRAAEFGRRLQKSLVAVHNVEPQTFTSMDIISTPGPPGPDPALSIRSAQLARAAERLPVETRTIVLHEFNSADAILGQAQAGEADLVILGTRQRSWFDGLANVSVATQVINRAQHSVLVLPLDEPAPLA